MFLIDPILTHFNLTWNQQQPIIRPLPPHIKRTLVPTPDGPLELLICEPKPTHTNPKPRSTPAPPIFFLHGGMGHATVWLEWLTYLHDHNYPSTLYSFSARGHGASHMPSYKTLVHDTKFEDILSDAAYCLAHIAQTRKQSTDTTHSTRPPILVGHSSGGGLAQALLHGTYVSPNPNADVPLKVRASGLCLVDAIPHYGSLEMYWNWTKQDPYWLMRSMFHLMHPMSPLSTTELVHNAFFGRKYPRARAEEFRSWFSGYESMEWPMAMLGRTKFSEWWGGKPNEWLDVGRLVDALDGLQKGEKVCLVIGKEDMMYRSNMWERECDEFRAAIRKVRAGNVKDGEIEGGVGEPIPAVTVQSADGVRLVLVDDAGHHVQNDVYCDETAEAVLRWANQI